MRKITKMNEIGWVIAVLLCALGVALCTKAGFGLSMVASPGYVLHLYLHDIIPWYSQGTSEYIWQGLQLIVLCAVIRRFHVKYLLSFLTAVISGYTIDFWLFCLGGGDVYTALPFRIAAFIIGCMFIAFAVAIFFRTNLPPQICELVVAESSRIFGWDTNRTKFCYDILMLVIAVLLTFLLRQMGAVGIGTVIAALINAPLITLLGNFLDRHFSFESRFPKLTKKLQ